MILISHRGNIDGINRTLENSTNYIEEAISKNYDVEIDIWYKDNKLYLGHDNPQYNISIDWINKRRSRLWIHCKNIDAINYLYNYGTKFNYFWHENDKVTMTSHQYIWAYPGEQPIKNSIAVLPEIFNDKLTDCIGICSDYISRYLNE